MDQAGNMDLCVYTCEDCYETHLRDQAAIAMSARDNFLISSEVGNLMDVASKPLVTAAI